MTKQEARVRAKALVAQMTVEEKASQLLFNSPAIERLGIREYNWWNEASHGVARAGTATVFPHAIALAATFDASLVKEVADVISTEARVKYNRHVTYGDRDIYKGLTFWSPNINIFRDPRWGRGQETFGEDPYLAALLGVAYVKGLQGDGPFLKASACSKHFAVHSGPEGERHGFDAITDDRDLWETYLPAFEKTVEAGVSGVMGAYNRTNGAPCCAHPLLLVEILRKKWGFDGYITSDCGALKDVYQNHHYVETAEEAAAVALKATCDLNCGNVYGHIIDAYESDLITEQDITAAAENLYTVRFLLGEFEETRPFSDIPDSLLDSAAHRALNLRAAQKSLVLAQNRDGFLPLEKTPKRIAVVGPNSLSTAALEGNYNGYASEYVTVADGIRRVFREAEVQVEQGSKISLLRYNWANGFGNMHSDGVATAASADLTVLCLGLDRTVEGEETGRDDAYSRQGDKKSLYLPEPQMKLAEAVCDVCENVIVVILAGSSVDVGEKVRAHAKAIIYGWYPGAMGGLAVAQLLAGDYSPCGRFPVTVHYGSDTLPPFTDYAMKGRTYRYMETEPLYPFGYGLSYTAFTYADAMVVSADDTTVTLRFTVKNIGQRQGTEIAQVYAAYQDSRTPTPHFQLCDTLSVNLSPGESQTLTRTLDRYWLKAVLSDGSRVTPDGKITLYVGGRQPDKRSEALAETACLSIPLQ